MSLSEAFDPSVRDYADTSYENRGGHRPDFLSIVVRAGVLGVSPAKLGRRMTPAIATSRLRVRALASGSPARDGRVCHPPESRRA